MKRAFFSSFCFPGVYTILACILLVLTPSINNVHTAKGSNKQSLVDSTPTTDFKNFTGSWVSHGAGLQLHADGSGVYSERVYQWCSATVNSPCDALLGNTIISGDEEKMQFTRTENNIAYGKVTASTINNLGLAVMLIRTTTNDTISLTSNGGHFATPHLLCGSRAAIGLCGA